MLAAHASEYVRTRASIVGNRPSTFSCAAPAKPPNVPVTVPVVFTAVYNNVTLYAIPNGLSDALQQVRVRRAACIEIQRSTAQTLTVPLLFHRQT